MRILALETSDKTGGAAAIDGCNVLAELTLDQNLRSAQSLAPAIKNLIEQVKWQPADVQLVAVTVGPGSFTGLRVGVTTAKIFAYAVSAEVLGVDTLESVAMNCAPAICRTGRTGCQPVPTKSADASRTGCQPVPTKSADPSRTGCQPVLHVSIDAQRGDVVARTFEVESANHVQPIGPEELIPLDEWLQRLTPGSFVSGPALLRHAERLPPNVAVMDRELWFPCAAAVGLLAARDYAAGRRGDIWKLAPRYSRRSAAEEKWDAMGR
ncbi:MAG: tRNA (adenosine(37)-N6)-threonylcarbamoyltransferase complex dimerization subunit type 1 TsaB [Pirellulaceae bacterium]|nr:tRNA (adenosine(37)-N6)-threonylcarbamoyltransferase complex dimerization subunit type 1 TsaB [Pirellulaceae bacterium]